ncbi:hypothetical protein TCAL_06375 [Tigriopus californicus]|uniref:Uncharacterized protein n=1 Tax=Tigriopus californicus TaxID=6832 RepID=A0A553PH42_TIGCA|nr:uncharacterized protein LOC131881065 [Tigriopus californicus]TRY77008.1 hypothetical protein TCAL_06375 [Tigriopus californicus]|eukprot:TCALIF_06375-PA protein Name:"Protein of unknown function" AED:0.10 eAED:0.05 QI:58/1/0.33/1/1/1/3/0/645
MIKFQNTWRFWLGCLMFAQIQSSPVLSDLRSRKRSDFIEEDVEPISYGTNAQTFQDGNLNRRNLPLKGSSFKFADPIIGQAFQPFNDVKSRVLTRIHRPDDPKFQLLLQRIRPIIGNETKLAFRSMQSNRGSEVEVKGRPEKVLFYNVLTIMKNGLQNTTGSKDFDNHDEITDIKFKIENCLEKLNAGTLPSPEEVSDLARRFNDLFQTKAEDSDPIRNRQAEDPNAMKAKAPFCDPGQDCFEDVDHEEIALEVNRLAKSLANYIKSRANQDQQIRKTGSGKGFEAKVKFKTDAVLTEITAILARLHRSVLRNWHHILMILNNMAGEDTKNVGVYRQGAFDLPSDPLINIEEFECNLEISGLKEAAAVTTKCLDEGIWHTDEICVSPIKDPIQECSPHLQNDNFVQIHGQNLFTIGHPGLWQIKVEIQVIADAGEHLAHFEQVIGSVSKLPRGSDDEAVPLFKIGHAVKFTENHGEGHTTSVSTGMNSDLDIGDRIVLRMGKTRDKLRIKFSGKLLTSRETEHSPTKTYLNSGPEDKNAAYKSLKKFSSSARLAQIEEKRLPLKGDEFISEESRLSSTTEAFSYEGSDEQSDSTSAMESLRINSIEKETYSLERPSFNLTTDRLSFNGSKDDEDKYYYSEEYAYE